MRKKFKIFYPKDHTNNLLAGKEYKLDKKSMIVMNGNGVFFVVRMNDYYPYIRRLSDVIGNYSVMWN